MRGARRHSRPWVFTCMVGLSSRTVAPTGLVASGGSGPRQPETTSKCGDIHMVELASAGMRLDRRLRALPDHRPRRPRADSLCRLLPTVHPIGRRDGRRTPRRLSAARCPVGSWSMRQIALARLGNVAHPALTNLTSSTKSQIPEAASTFTPIVHVPPVTAILSIVGCVHFCHPVFTTATDFVSPDPGALRTKIVWPIR